MGYKNFHIQNVADFLQNAHLIYLMAFYLMNWLVQHNITRIDADSYIQWKKWPKNCYLALIRIHLCPNCVQMCIPPCGYLTLVGCISNSMSPKQFKLSTWFCHICCLLIHKWLFVPYLDTWKSTENKYIRGLPYGGQKYENAPIVQKLTILMCF